MEERPTMNDLIGPDDLHQRQQGEVVPLVIDVRGTDEYAEGHLAGALQIPADELPSRLDEIPRDRLIVTT